MKCSKCGVCCRLFLINLTEKEYLSKRYNTQFQEFFEDFKQAKSVGANLLAQHDDGSCIYLDNNVCSIHDKKPKCCRDFFCESKDPAFKGMINKINEYKKKS